MPSEIPSTISHSTPCTEWSLWLWNWLIGGGIFILAAAVSGRYFQGLWPEATVTLLTMCVNWLTDCGDRHFFGFSFSQGVRETSLTTCLDIFLRHCLFLFWHISGLKIELNFHYLGIVDRLNPSCWIEWTVGLASALWRHSGFAKLV